VKSKSVSAESGDDTSSSNGRTVIGWSEPVDFVTWGIRGLNAKVDTGARTSALHVENMEFLPENHVRFDVVLSRRLTHRRKSVTARISRWANVRSSTGHYTERCFVKTKVRIGPIVKNIEVSLISRERMIYRMLIGREALNSDFLVDVSHRSIHAPKKKRRKLTKRKRES
jgi:hypothetical protein